MQRLLILALVLLSFWLRLENLDTLPTGLSNDEAVNAIDAFHILRSGNFPMYEDHGRPEPLYRIVLAVGGLFYGVSIWAFRFTTALLGTFTVATTYWATRQCLYDLPSTWRALAALAAAAALAVAISHVTLSRALYRAILQPPFMLLFLGLLLRGLRTDRRRDFVLSGVFLALALYSYTSALIVPLALIPVAAQLLIFRRDRWRKWAPRLVLLGVVCAVLMLPVGWRLLDNPQAVLGRSAEVNRGTGLNLSQQSISGVVAQFFERGDINPQYNVERAPLLPRSFVWLFLVGLLALVVRVRQPASWLVAALLVLTAIPVIAGSEIPHGLRIMGEFAVFPLVIGLGAALILTLVYRLVMSVEARRALSRYAITVTLVALLALTWGEAAYTRHTYAAYWSKTEGYEYTWRIFGRELPIADWFFRPDRRDFARWLAAQEAPLLVPLDELNTQTTRAWLLTAYPNVVAKGDDFVIPAGARLVAPWSLELDGLRKETRHYALLDNGTIMLLPPLSADTHAALLEDIEQGEPITRPGALDFMGYVSAIPEGREIAFEPRTITSVDTPIAAFGDEVQLVSWRGPELVSGSGTATYTLDWRATRLLGHEYSTFLQLQTQDYQRIAGDEGLVWRWLFPSTQWRVGDVVPDVHTLEIPPDLQPGAYRLVAGVYVSTFVEQRLPATFGLDISLGDAATIGWVKVPQRDVPPAGQDVVTPDAVLNEMFALRGAGASLLDDGRVQIRLTWEALAERPEVDATIFVHLVNAAGEMVAQQDARPWGGQYPTFIWGAGEHVRTDYILDIGEADPNGLSLRVGMYTFPDLARLPVIQDGKPVADAFVTVGRLGELLQK